MHQSACGTKDECHRVGLMKAARFFKGFMWMTIRETWSRRRRVVGKAEFTKEGPNPRFVVTSLKRKQCKTRYLYEKLYCARGEMENRIKECQGTGNAPRSPRRCAWNCPSSQPCPQKNLTRASPWTQEVKR